MEFALPVKIKIWEAGIFKEYEGLVNRLDGVNKVIYLEMKDGYIMKIKFQDIVGVELRDEIS